ncbi:Tn3 family transposase [Sphaerisporangium viridialbum]|uniref:Tn3 family transposase n=1 Tax=Sphaerisporangium viridialbum TaxID=46189 RepID=UPI003C72514C
MVVHSQTLRASASEGHAMAEGAVRHGTARHGTSMKIEGNDVDSHVHSEIGFGVTRLLGFDLLSQIKQVKLYRVELAGATCTRGWGQR